MQLMSVSWLHEVAVVLPKLTRVDVFQIAIETSGVVWLRGGDICVLLLFSRSC